MAVTITAADVFGGSLPHEFSRLFVIGVRPGDGRDELTSLLADHAVTDGFAFLPPGTPTNNLDATSTTPTYVPDPTLPPPDVVHVFSMVSVLFVLEAMRRDCTLAPPVLIWTALPAHWFAVQLTDVSCKVVDVPLLAVSVTSAGHCGSVSVSALLVVMTRLGPAPSDGISSV